MSANSSELIAHHRKVQIRRRPRHPKKDSLFVRLSSNLIKDLKSDAMLTMNQELGVDAGAQERSWNVSIQGSNDDDTFLPLEISCGEAKSPHLLYASFNGSIIEDTEGVMEVPDSLLPPTFAGYERLLVRALPSIRHCTRVQMDPKSTEDWELLEVHATALEEGDLLRQVSVVYPRQQLSLYLPNSRAVVQLEVGEVSTTTDTEGLWPETTTTSSLASPNCALLVQDTQVIITPKPRPRTKESDWSKPLRLVPCDQDWTEEMWQLAEIWDNGTSKYSQTTNISSSPMVVPPACILINDSVFHKIFRSGSTSTWARISKPSSDDHSKSRLVQVQQSSLVPMDHAVLHPWIRFDLGLSLYSDSIQIQPCEKEPESLTIASIEDTILLRPIRVKEPSTPTEEMLWRMPDMDTIVHGSPGTTTRRSGDESRGSSCYSFPVGSIISASQRLEDDEESPGLFRLTIREGQNAGQGATEKHPSWMKELVRFNKKALQRLVKGHPSTRNGPDSGMDVPETIEFPKTLKRFLQTPIVTSIEWTKPLLQEAEISNCTNVILCGPTGSGKTHSALLLGLLSSIQQHKSIFYMDCARLKDASVRMQELLDELCTLFMEAHQAQYAVIILDDVDRLIPNLLGEGDDDQGGASSRVQGANPVAVDQSKTVTDLILQQVDALCVPSCRHEPGGTDLARITVISTCASVQSLNPAIRKGINSKSIDLPSLTKSERRAVLLQILSAGSESVDWCDLHLPDISESFRPRDLVKLACRLQQKLRSSRGSIPPLEALESVLDDYVPMSNMTLSQSKVAAGPNWDGIGGLFKVKAKLESLLLHPSRYRGIYSQASVRLPRGAMLFGPPGCGKSILVPALAKECGFPVIACKGPEVLDKYIGASEAKVRELFDRAMSVAPSVLFLDELDALAPRRGSDHTGVTDRVVNQLLTYLDGVEDAAKGTVYVIGASSRPDKIDPALLRPGRLEEHLLVGPPDNDEEWTDLFTKVSRGWNLSVECREYLPCDSGMGLPTPLILSGRFTAADFRSCLDTAHVSAVHRALASSPAENLKEVLISKEDLKAAFAVCKPSLAVDDAQALARIYRPFMKDHGDSKSARQSVSCCDSVGSRTALR